MPLLEARTIKVEVLTDIHRVEDFDCGEPARNSWLVNRGLSNQRSDDTRTYVALQDDEVMGFYALAVSSIVRGALSGSLSRNAPDPVSCVLLAQLAVATEYQGKGLGRKLMLHAMGQTVKIAEIAGCRLLSVHPARPDLVGYYSNFDFSSVATSPPMMAMSLRKVRNILAKVATAHSKSTT